MRTAFPDDALDVTQGVLDVPWCLVLLVMFSPTIRQYFTVVAAFTVIQTFLGCGDEPIGNTRTAGEEG